MNAGMGQELAMEAGLPIFVKRPEAVEKGASLPHCLARHAILKSKRLLETRYERASGKGVIAVSKIPDDRSTARG